MQHNKNYSSEDHKNSVYNKNFYQNTIPFFPNCCASHKKNILMPDVLSDDDLIFLIEKSEEESFIKFVKISQLLSKIKIFHLISKYNNNQTIASLLGICGTKKMITHVLNKLDQNEHLEIFYEIFVQILNENRIFLLFDILKENKKYAEICIKCLFNPLNKIYIIKNNKKLNIIKDIILIIENKEDILNIIQENKKICNSEDEIYTLSCVYTELMS